MRVLRLFLPLLMSVSSALSAPGLEGTWQLEFPRRGGVTILTYLDLRQEGSALDGTVVINRAADLPLRNPRYENGEGVFSIDWNAAYRVRRDADRLRVHITYGGKRTEEVIATPVAKAVTRPPAALPLPALTRVPDNGLVRTPPMGWNSWNHFADRVDDRIVREAADALVATGLAAAGYVYINVDDCWEGGRDAAGNLVPNEKFPDMKALADYVHSRGLKLGLYTSPGPFTCGGYEGSYGHEERDARTFAAWGIDYLKYDWCSASRIYSLDQARAVFQKMGAALANCGRPIVYSLSSGLPGMPEWARDTGANLWRTTDDIQDNWKSVSQIGFSQSEHASRAGPGHWNDPDMLEVGNGGMTDTEYRTHFSLWCLLAAPLIAGNDLRSMSPATLEILANREAIAVDQDPLGQPGRRIAARDGVELWARPLHDGGQAVGVFNRNETEATAQFAWSELGLDAPPCTLRDLWLHQDVAPRADGITATLPAHGVLFLRL